MIDSIPKMPVTYAMNGVLSVRLVLWGLERQPQILNLNQGVDLCARREVSAF